MKMSFESLEQRHQSEKVFHDSKFSKKGKKDYYALGVNGIIYNKMIEKIGDLTGKKAVDFGCGNGWQTKLLVDKGAQVWAFDISDEAVKKTKQMSIRHNIEDRIHVEQMAAESLKYKDNEFDIVLGNAILHHLDIDIASKEIHRVLKPGGKAYFLEPLGYNPLINLFRKLTPNMRTKDEEPLRLEHFDIIQERFAGFEHEEYYLTVLVAFFWYFIFRQDNLFMKSVHFMNRLDRVLLRAAPCLKKYCWYSILIMEK